VRYSIALIVILCAAQPALGQYYRYEAENGTMHGTVVRSSIPGYSGTGYVTEFDSTLSGGDYFELNVNVPDGLFEMWVGYRSPYGQKGYDYQVDGQYGSGTFDQSTTFSADRAGLFNMSGGTNTLGIYQSWGWYDVDYLEFRPFTPPTPSPVPATLTDPLADAHTQTLMNYMTALYGSKTLSGQQANAGEDLFPTQDYLNKSGGIVPAIRGSDFMEYSPSRIEHGSNPNNESERMVNWARQTGGAVTMMWHWNAPTDLVDAGDWPWWRGFYTQGTTFDLPGALANPAGEDYQLILRDIDAIAGELQKFEDAGVPVIWRPLHEAQGGWFWWGAHGADTFKDLWHLMYDRLTNEHGLHNLIWEFTSSAAEGDYLDWYPGDDEVDIVSLDIYTDPTSSMSGQWYDVLAEYDGRKMVALSETGTLPEPDVMDTYGIEWSYFSPWNWDFIRNKYLNEEGYTEAQLAALLQNLLSHEDIITLDELPLMPWSNAATVPGDYNGDGTVDAADYTVWRDSLGSTEDLAADGNINGQVDEGDYDVWKEHFGETAPGSGAGSATNVPEPASALLWLLTAGLTAGLTALGAWGRTK
jgi:mannan endo-1,4-beta-mannosidase